MKQLLIMILMLLISFTSFSQESPSSFSLEEAIQYALENNRAAKNAQLDIEAAKNKNGKLRQQVYHKLVLKLITKIF